MNFSDELVTLRYYLRDPDGNIWSEELIRTRYNEAQHDLQNETGILEDIINISIPPSFNGSFMFDWEHYHIDGNRYQCFLNSGNQFTCTSRWEVQEDFDIDSDVSEEGHAFTHPFEAFLYTPSYPPSFPFPDNFHTSKGMYYDEEPLDYCPFKEITSLDPSWQTRSGEPVAYTRLDTVSNQFLVYPRPSTVSWVDSDGAGMVTSVEDDTTDSDTGVVAFRTGTFLTDTEGLAVSVIESEDNLVLLYDVEPSEVTGPSDDLDWPQFLRRYVRYRALEKLYRTNNDGRIESLAQYWGQRYRLGIEAVKRFRAKRMSDRNYRLLTKEPVSRRNPRHARLPDGYPATYP